MHSAEQSFAIEPITIISVESNFAICDQICENKSHLNLLHQNFCPEDTLKHWQPRSRE